MSAWTFDVDHAVLGRLREVCLALPAASERLSHGSSSFFVGAKVTATGATGGKTFVSYVDDHHGDGILGIWCAAPAGAQEALVAGEPGRFYRPPYVGHRGWLGMRLDRDLDWDEVAAVVEDAYCCVATKTLVRQVRPPSPEESA